jgi:phosphinothricin acetyltransferase
MVKDTDAEAIARLYNYYIVSSTATFEEQVVSHLEIEKRIHKVQENGFPWLVSEVNNEIEGYAYANKWNLRSAYRFTAEVSVYISKDKTSKGLGASIYTELFTMLKAMSIREVVAIITLPNERSVSLHEKLGMKKVAHLEQVGFKFDEWLDVGYWQGHII